MAKFFVKKKNIVRIGLTMIWFSLDAYENKVHHIQSLYNAKEFCITKMFELHNEVVIKAHFYSKCKC